MTRDDPLAAVLAEHDPMLRRIASGYERDPERRRELEQDLRFAVWRALPRHRGEAPIKGFVARVAHNRALTYVAREAAEPRRTELDETWAAADPDPAARSERADMRRRLERAAAALPLSLRQPTMLTLEGFSPAEIGDILGLGANAVSIRLTRARQTLRAALDPEASR